MSQAFSIPYADEESFLGAAQALLPPGDAWPQEQDARLTSLLSASTASLARVHMRLADLTEQEAIPWLAEDLLPAWEATYGLPDPCSPLNSTIAQRQAAVKAKIAAGGGQDGNYFENVAAALGYMVTITKFTVARAGRLRAGQPIYGAPWFYAWQVNTTSKNTQSDAQLTCTLNRIKPAYSALIMNFTAG